MARRSTGLSERLRKIMTFLGDFQGKNGYSPSIRQIGENIGVGSTSLVDYYLNQLQQMSLIERDQHVSRSIRVLQPLVDQARRVAKAVTELLAIPVLGRIVASEPIPMPPTDSTTGYFDAESSIEIARSLLPAKEKVDELFALEVQGESMIDALVNNGDIVIMKSAQVADNGDMVAVWLDDENRTTLKFFYKEKNHIRLQPANPNMDPIIIKNPQHLRIMGKVIMVIRQVESLAV
jgi:repressor LexA